MPSQGLNSITEHQVKALAVDRIDNQSGKQLVILFAPWQIESNNTVVTVS